MSSLYFYCTNSLLHTITKDQNKSACTKNISLQSFELLVSIQKKKKKKTYGMPYCFCLFFITNMLHILQIASTDNEFCCFTSSFRNESGRTKRTHQTPIFTNVCRPNTILASNTILEKISSKVPQSLYDSNQQFPPP